MFQIKERCFESGAAELMLNLQFLLVKDQDVQMSEKRKN